MGRTDMPSSQQTPSYVIPQFGKSMYDGAKATGTERRDVFGEYKPMPNLLNKSELRKPQAATLAGNAHSTTS